MFGIEGKSKRIMKNKCERNGVLKKYYDGEVDEGKNGVDRAVTKFWLKDAVEKIEGLIST